MARVASKLEWLRNRPDFQENPEKQRLLQHFEELPEKVDPLLPWLAREVKKKRLTLTDTPIEADNGRLVHAELGRLTSVHPGMLSHWADWYADENHPTRRGMDIMRQTFPDVRKRVEDWEDDLQRQMDQRRIAEGGEVVHTTPDNWTIRKLTTPEELADEGEAMGHCVGGYGSQVANGQSLIYSLRDPEHQPHTTLEITPNNPLHGYGPWLGPNKGRIVQIQGKSDEVPKPEYQSRIKNWFETFDPEDRPHWPETSVSDARALLDPEDMDYETEDEDGYGGYGPHGDYGVATPRRYDWDSILNSTLDDTQGGHYYRNQGPEYQSEWGQRAYETARREGQIPEYAKALEGFGEKAHESYNDLTEQNLDYLDYPGEEYEENPEHWDAIAQQGQESPSDYYPTYLGHPATGQEAFQSAREAYEENERELINQHEPSKATQDLYSYLVPHHNPATGQYENQIFEHPGTFSHTASTPLYFRWVFIPSTGEVDLSTNADHPADVRYHGDLASDHPEPGLIHGYAYRIDGGWRLTDWDHKPVVDPFVVAQVMRKLRATSGPQDASWENAGDDFDRMHLGLPGRF